jgi:hypothetical protein
VEASNGEVVYTFGGSSSGADTESSSTNPSSSGSSSSSRRSSSGGWPVLMELDGGREVHALQVGQ